MLTLAQVKEGRSDKVEKMIVDLFIRKSEVLELMPFANDVAADGGSTLTYGYVQEKAPSTAGFRAIGQEYTSSEALVEPKNATLKIFGGSFEIDRVIKTIEGQFNNMAYQLEKKIEAAVGLFHDKLINGDEGTNALEFDGLDEMLTGTANELNVDSYFDLSTIDKIKENADAFYEALLNLINKTGAHALMVNEQTKTKIQTVARVLGYKTESEEAFGRTITSINEGKVRLIDLGNKYEVTGTEADANIVVTAEPIVGKYTRNIASSDVTGLTDIYAVKFDVNEGFHGVTIQGDKVIDQYLPDFNTPGAVKKGEVEMVACVVLKNTNNAGVLRNIKIA